MAKQLVNPFERHVEKGVLGVAALLLIGVIAKYFVSTPNKLEFGGETVTPTTCDDKVQQKGTEVLAAIRAAKKPDLPVPETPTLQTTIKFAALPALAPFHPPTPIVDKPEKGGWGKSRLVEVVELGRPEIVAGRSTVDLPSDIPTSTESKGPAMIDWVTVSAVFDLKEQADRQEQQYGSQKKAVTFAGVEMQRRQQRPDGRWSDEDWTTIDNWPSANVPPPPNVPLQEADGKVTIRKADHEQILKWREVLAEPRMQLDIVRPLLPKIKNGDCWELPLPKPVASGSGSEPKLTERDILKQDDDIRRPTDAPMANPENRYPVCKETAPAPTSAPTEATSQVTVTQRIIKAEEKFRAAKETCREELCKEIRTELNTVQQLADLTSAEKNRIRVLENSLRNLESDIKAKTCKPSGGGKGGTRDLQPYQLVWAIDGAPGSLESGKTYQYRVRVNLYNPRTGEPDQYLDPQDATKAILPGPWSEPTEPIHVEPATQYYLADVETGKDDLVAKFDFMQWFNGEWIKPRGGRAEVRVGDRVFYTARADAPDPVNRNNTITPELTFDGNATLVNIDSKRNFRERKSMGKNGVKFQPGESVCVLLVHENGELEERFELIDKSAKKPPIWKSLKPGP